MPSRDSLREELDLLDELKPLVTAKQEIAVMRIQEPQKRVLAARQFFKALLSVFSQVRQAYSNEVESLRKERTGHAAILFSTDEHLTGPITTATFRHFVEFITLHKAAPIVIGAVGKARFTLELPGVKFTYLQLSSQGGDDQKALTSLMRLLLKYEKLTFIYGQYRNLINQEAVDVTVGGTDEKQQGNIFEHYFFEPSLESIVSFFDKNLIALLLQQTSEENELAKLGSQITAMERADTNITLRLQELLWKSRQQFRQDRNKKQRERMAGLQLWGS